MNEATCSRTFPERRAENAHSLDVDLTIPNRRATDRRMQNTLILQAFKASEKRFTGEAISTFGAFA